MKEIQESGVLDKAGSFQLNPVSKNAYWYNGTSYEYNQYEIKITSEPGSARIIWEDRYIGTTPFIYQYTGTLDKGDRVNVRAMPVDNKMKPQTSSLKITQELPREIKFKLE